MPAEPLILRPAGFLQETGQRLRCSEYRLVTCFAHCIHREVTELSTFLWVSSLMSAFLLLYLIEKNSLFLFVLAVDKIKISVDNPIAWA